MQCGRKGCLASYTWFGHPDDPVLASLARQSGWRVHDVTGWICPHHAAIRSQALSDLIAADAHLIDGEPQ